MRFPNAYAGVKKIFAAQILNLFTLTVYFVIAVLFAVWNDEEVSETTLTVIGVVTIFAMVVGVVSFIVQFIGLVQARRDERVFRKAKFFVVVSVIATVVSYLTAGTFSSIFSGIDEASTLLVNVYTIMGFYNLALLMDDKTVQNRCKIAVILVAVIFTFALLAQLSKVFMPDVLETLNIICGGLEVVGTVVFVRYLSRAKKMLAA